MERNNEKRAGYTSPIQSLVLAPIINKKDFLRFASACNVAIVIFHVTTNEMSIFATKMAIFKTKMCIFTIKIAIFTIKMTIFTTKMHVFAIW